MEENTSKDLYNQSWNEDMMEENIVVNTGGELIKKLLTKQIPPGQYYFVFDNYISHVVVNKEYRWWIENKKGWR